jgi:TPR repeat protein
VNKKQLEFRRCEEAAYEGNSQAQNLLGYYYWKGIGVKPNVRTAFLCFYWTATKYKDADAQSMLAYCYEHGLGG